MKEEVSTNYNVGVSIRPSNNITFSVDAYRVLVKDRVVLSGQFSADDASLSAELRQTLQDLKVSYAQFLPTRSIQQIPVWMWCWIAIINAVWEACAICLQEMFSVWKLIKSMFRKH